MSQTRDRSPGNPPGDTSGKPSSRPRISDLHRRKLDSTSLILATRRRNFLGAHWDSALLGRKFRRSAHPEFGVNEIPGEFPWHHWAVGGWAPANMGSSRGGGCPGEPGWEFRETPREVGPYRGRNRRFRGPPTCADDKPLGPK